MLDSNVYGMKYVILILCTGLFIYPAAANGPRCFDCLRMPYLHECDHIKQCGPHQVCYSKQIVSDSGFVYYDTGCIDQLICNARDSLTDHADDGQADDIQADEKGDIITCLECCDGEFCNDRGCGTKGLSTNQTGPSCFSCPKGSVSPWHCDKVTTCGRDEKCFIQQVSGIGGNVLYKTGCTSSCAFDLIGVGTIVGKRSLATGCSGCCGTDFCNSNCSLLENNVLSPTKHVVTVKSTQTITTTSGQHSTSTMPTTTATPVCRLSHYIYAAIQGTCFHVYDNKQLSMSAARQECQREGADLLQLKDSNAEHFFQHLSFNDKENNNRRYWLGAHKHTDGNFYWIDGRKVDSSYEWAPGEPNNYLNKEECLDLTWFAANPGFNIPEAFALNDDNCDMNYFYICEDRPNHMPNTWVTHAMTSQWTHAMTSQWTPAITQCRNSHYIYTAVQSTCYHVYDNKQLSMSAARQECQKEGADLLQLKDANAEHFFQHLSYNDKENNNRRYWLGAQKHNDGNYFWFDGRKVDSSYAWAPGEPNNYLNREECLDLTWFPAVTDLHIPEAFAFNDDNCDTSYFYICEETRGH